MPATSGPAALPGSRCGGVFGHAGRHRAGRRRAGRHRQARLDASVWHAPRQTLAGSCCTRSEATPGRNRPCWRRFGHTLLGATPGCNQPAHVHTMALMALQARGLRPGPHRGQGRPGRGRGPRAQVSFHGYIYLILNVAVLILRLYCAVSAGGWRSPAAACIA